MLDRLISFLLKWIQTACTEIHDFFAMALRFLIMVLSGLCRRLRRCYCRSSNLYPLAKRAYVLTDWACQLFKVLLRLFSAPLLVSCLWIISIELFATKITRKVSEKIMKDTNEGCCFLEFKSKVIKDSSWRTIAKKLRESTYRSPMWRFIWSSRLPWVLNDLLQFV